MKLYADAPARRTRQVLADVGLLAWAVGCVLVALLVHRSVLQLAEPGRRVEAAGAQIADGMQRAGDQLGRLPLVGDGMRSPFDQLASAAASLQQAGADMVAGFERLAIVCAVFAGLIPLLIVALIWFLGRWRFIRTASAAASFLDDDADLSLLALRALTRQPLDRLARISTDPVGGWRAGDPQLIESLASLELAEHGLHFRRVQGAARPPTF
jgi:hypothetical protein